MGSSSNQNSVKTDNTTSNSTTTSAPGWAPQTAALTTAFNEAGGALTNAQSVAAPTGTTADLTGNGALSNNGVSLSNNGTNAAGVGLGKLTDYNASATNNPQSILDAAQKYVDGQNIDAQVNNSMLNARQTARDVTLPGINQAAAISGNADSSRNGIAQGLVERGLAEQANDLGATLRNQAWNTGLNLAETQANQNNGLNLTAANQAAGQGSNAVNSGQNAYSGALNNTGTANNINQGNFGNSVSNDFAALQAYMNLIGNKSWGQTTNSSGTSNSVGTGNTNTQNDPGILSNISSGLGVLGALL